MEVVLSNVSYPMRGDKEVSGIVTALVSPTNGHNPIPAGGMVLSAWGSTKADILAHAHVGDRLRMKFLSGAEEYNTSDNAVTGIGWIIHNGAAYSGRLAEPRVRGVRHLPAAESGAGVERQHVVPGGHRRSQSAASVGMTFQEMANFLIGTLNAREAVNYDGGGSATMVVNGAVRNVPSDGSERYVANAILLVKKDTATAFPVSDDFVARRPGVRAGTTSSPTTTSCRSRPHRLAVTATCSR